MTVGYLRCLGVKRPDFTDNGILVKSGNDDFVKLAKTQEKRVLIFSAAIVKHHKRLRMGVLLCTCGT